MSENNRFAPDADQDPDRVEPIDAQPTGDDVAPDPIEAVVKATIVRAARRVVVLCDASKQDQETLTRFCSLEQIDTFITDRAPVGELAQALEDADVEVVLA